MGLAALTDRSEASAASVPRGGVAPVASVVPVAPAGSMAGGSVTSASLLASEALRVAEPLAGLFPAAGIRRGNVVEVSGSTTLALLVLAAALPAHDWAAVVGLSSLGAAAAVEAGIDLTRLALVPEPGSQWSRVVAALFDGFTVVLAGSPRQRLSAGDANRLVARARERGSVLLVRNGWPLPTDQRLVVTSDEWQGLGWGQGRLRSRRLDVVASGRAGASRERRLSLLLSPGHPTQQVSAGGAGSPVWAAGRSTEELRGDLRSSVGG